MAESFSYKALFELSPSAIVLEDEQGTIVDVNPALCRIMGYSREELVGANIRTFVPPESVDAVVAHLAEILSGRVLFHVVTNIRKDGTPVDLELHERCVTLPDGKTGVIVIANDVTERVLTEQALRTSQLFIEKLAETSPNALYVFDVVQGKNIFSTPRLAGLLGYAMRELDAFGDGYFSELLHPDDRERATEHLKGWEGAAEDPVRTIEYRLRHKNGSWKWFFGSETVFSRNEQGRVVLIIGTAQDISEQKEASEAQRRLEHQMFQTQKLESLGLMAGSLAHDFNNMLIAIMGNIDLALMDLPADSPVRVRLASAGAASHSAADLCRQLLAYTGKGGFVVEPVNLNNLLRGIEPTIRASIPQRIDMRYELEIGLPTVIADASQLRQVVMNLVINAAESIGDRPGKITITTSSVTCDGSEPPGSWMESPPAPGSYAAVTVTDTGSGIPPDVLTRIFEPFYTTKFTGRGLGLPAVLGVIKGQHGAVQVDSTPGHGSRFRFVLPASKQTAAAHHARSSTSDEWRGAGTVLIIDDEEQVRVVGKTMLERMGFKVVLACDGNEAIDLVRGRPDAFDFMLLDLTMPNKDGIETLADLRSIRQDSVVILTSGYTEEDVLHRLQGARYAAFVQKPFTYNTLRNAFQRAAAR